MEKLKIIKLGSFNVLNLELPNVRYYGNKFYTEDIYEKKINWIASQLDRMDVDIVGFQEVFSEEALREALQRTQKLKDAHLIISEKIGGSPAVALASRFQILNYQIIQNFPEALDFEGVELPMNTFSRPVLEATVEISENVAITFFVAHLKSKRPTIPDGVDARDLLEKAKGEARSLIRRVGEATALRTILMQHLRQRTKPVVVMGDLNDNHLAVTTQIISGEPPFRQWDFESKKQVWDALLYHAKAIQARKSYHDYYYSHIHNGHYEALDHILVSQELVTENPNSIGRVGYVITLNDHLIDETLSDDKVEPWQSDHAQVVVSIEMK